jgi:flagellar biosynthesis protein FlhF
MEIDMKIKRYLADSMRAALSQVRAEQGPDAVILSSRRVEEGIEVIAAVDYDEALFVDATRQRAPAMAAETAAPASFTAESARVPPPAQTPSAPELRSPSSLKPTRQIPAPAAKAALTPNQPVPASTAALTSRVALTSRTTAAPKTAVGPGAAMTPSAAAAPRAAVALSAAVAPRAAVTPSAAMAPRGAVTPSAAMAPRGAVIPSAAMAPRGAVTPSAAVLPRAAVTPSAVAAPRLALEVGHRPLSRTPQPQPDNGFGAMQRELKDLRELLQGEMAHMSWNDKRLREPLQARVLEELSEMDIAPDVAMSLASLTPRRTSLTNPSHIPLALLVRHLPVVDKLTTVNGGVIALVGPTGAGKTTTIAKLAAHWSMRHGSQDLALVSTDGYRIGAREQLMTYARILGAPMHVANSGKELARVLERLKSKKLVLIDTAGMGPRDVRLGEQLSALQLGAARARVLLALPAQGEAHALDEMVRAFAPVSPAACILTKVDEAASLGAVLSTTLRHKLRIAYLCNGQRVPEDLHPAHQRRVWLVCAALKLKEGAPPRGDDGYYARNFGRAHAHA